jgi:hypothetical protein
MAVGGLSLDWKLLQNCRLSSMAQMKLGLPVCPLSLLSPLKWNLIFLTGKRATGERVKPFLQHLGKFVNAP